MKNIAYYLILVLFIFAACNDELTDDYSETDNEIKIETLKGQVQKGPYNNGTTIWIYELSDGLVQTGRVFKSEINNNRGEFEISNLVLSSPYVILEANGFYFNECSGENSEAQLTLSAIANVEDKSSLNINILSHLEKDRVMNLVFNGSSFKNAKRQAQNEILSVFEMDDSSDTIPSERLDINKAGINNAKLLAISAIMQIGNSTSDLSKLTANLKTDLYDNGTLDEDSLGNILMTQAQLIDKAEIRHNLENKCSKENMIAAIPNFESQIDTFISNSDYEINRLVSYPDSTFYGKNILSKDVDTVYYGDIYALAANMNSETTCKIVVLGKGFVPHGGLSNATNCTLSGDPGNRIYESIPDVEYMNTKVSFESWEADEFGVSYYTIEYYEGADELVKTHSKQLVAVQKDYTASYSIPAMGAYSENVWLMEGDTLKLQADRKYSFAFECYKDLDIQTLIKITTEDISQIGISEQDLMAYEIESSEGRIVLNAYVTDGARKYAAAISFKGHGYAEISGHISIDNNGELIRVKEMKRNQPVIW